MKKILIIGIIILLIGSLLYHSHLGKDIKTSLFSEVYDALPVRESLCVNKLEDFINAIITEQQLLNTEIPLADEEKEVILNKMDKPQMFSYEDVFYVIYSYYESERLRIDILSNKLDFDIKKDTINVFGSEERIVTQQVEAINKNQLQVSGGGEANALDMIERAAITLDIKFSNYNKLSLFYDEKEEILIYHSSSPQLQLDDFALAIYSDKHQVYYSEVEIEVGSGTEVRLYRISDVYDYKSAEETFEYMAKYQLPSLKIGTWLDMDIYQSNYDRDIGMVIDLINIKNKNANFKMDFIHEVPEAESIYFQYRVTVSRV